MSFVHNIDISLVIILTGGLMYQEMTVAASFCCAALCRRKSIYLKCQNEYLFFYMNTSTLVNMDAICEPRVGQFVCCLSARRSLAHLSVWRLYDFPVHVDLLPHQEDIRVRFDTPAIARTWNWSYQFFLAN